MANDADTIAALQAENAQLRQRVAELGQDQAVRKSAEQFRAFFEQSPIGIGVSRNGTTLMVNAAYLRMFGYDAPEEVVGKPIAEQIVPNERRAVVERAIKRLRGEAVEARFTLTGLRKDGTCFPLLCNVAQVVLQDGRPASVAFFTDITDQKRAEVTLAAERAALARRVEERTTELLVKNTELAQALRARDEFLANTSHELRTPLNAVLGLSAGLQEEVYGPLTDKQHAALRTIEQSGRQLLDLINDILELARIEAGQVELDIRQISVEHMCQAVLRPIRQAARQKKLAIAERLDPLVTTIQADERRLKQMLVNLLSNAVKFTPPGGHIGIEVSGDPDHQLVHLTVWDTGIGIAPEQHDRLFQPFVQIDSGLNRQYGGTGLGLALVARLAALHNGSIMVESEVGAGSRFTISLPWHMSAPEP